MSPRKTALVLLSLTSVAVCGQAATLSLSVGGETTELEITHCRTDTYQSGQLQVEAELTAVGTFRGRKATLLLWKVTDANSENIDLHLVELAPELRTVSPLAASGQMLNDYSLELGRRQQEVYGQPDPKELENLPPEEMLAKMDAAMEGQSKKLDAIEAEMDAEYAHTRSFGVITVDGSTIAFEGSDTRVIRGEQVEAFANVAGAPVRVTAECET